MLTVTVSVLFSFYLSWDINRVPYSPDEANVLFFSEHLVETGTPLWHSDLNDEYGVSFFRSRAMVDRGDNNYAPQGSMAWILVLSMGQIDNEFLNLQSLLSLLTALGILVVYLLTREVFDKKTALIAALLTCILSPYVAFSNTFNDILPTVVFYLLSLYYFFRFVNTRKSSYLGLASLFFVVSVFLRDANVITYIAGYIPLLVIFRERLNLRAVLTGFFSLALTLIPFGFINVIIYGGFFATGRSTIVAGGSEVGKPLIPFNIEYLSSVVYHHIFDFLPLLLLGILGMIAAYKLSPREERKTRMGFLVSVLVVMAATVLVYGSRPGLYGFGTGWLISSPTRYFLPIYIFLAVYVAALVRYMCVKAHGWGRTTAVLLVLALVVSFFNLSFGDAQNSLPDQRGRMARFSQQAATINRLPQDSIVFAQNLDKIVFPTRDVGIVFTEAALEERPFYALQLPIVDISSDVIPVIEEMLDNGKSVYVTADAKELITELRAGRYKVLESGAEWLYKIER